MKTKKIIYAIVTMVSLIAVPSFAQLIKQKLQALPISDKNQIIGKSRIDYNALGEVTTSKANQWPNYQKNNRSFIVYDKIENKFPVYSVNDTCAEAGYLGFENYEPAMIPTTGKNLTIDGQSGWKFTSSSTLFDFYHSHTGTYCLRTDGAITASQFKPQIEAGKSKKFLVSAYVYVTEGVTYWIGFGRDGNDYSSSNGRYAKKFEGLANFVESGWQYIECVVSLSAGDGYVPFVSSTSLEKGRIDDIRYQPIESTMAVSVYKTYDNGHISYPTAIMNDKGFVTNLFSTQSELGMLGKALVADSYDNNKLFNGKSAYDYKNPDAVLKLSSKAKSKAFDFESAEKTVGYDRNQHIVQDGTLNFKNGYGGSFDASTATTPELDFSKNFAVSTDFILLATTKLVGTPVIVQSQSPVCQAKAYTLLEKPGFTDNTIFEITNSVTIQPLQEKKVVKKI